MIFLKNVTLTLAILNVTLGIKNLLGYPSGWMGILGIVEICIAAALFNLVVDLIKNP